MKELERAASVRREAVEQAAGADALHHMQIC